MLIKKILEYTTLIYGLLIFVGYVNLHIYYSFFELPIYNFISFGEVLILFLPSLAEMMSVAVAVFLFLLFGLFTSHGEGSQEIFTKMISEIKNYQGWSSIWVVFREFVTQMLIIVLAVLLFSLIIIPLFVFMYYMSFFFPYRGEGNTVLVIYMIWILVLLISWIFSDRFFKKIESHYEFTLTQMKRRFILTITLYFVLGLVLKINEAETIATGKPLYFVKFNYNNKIINSDTATVYLGQSEKYLFLRNLKAKKNLIYEKGNVSFLEISTNK